MSAEDVFFIGIVTLWCAGVLLLAHWTVSRSEKALQFKNSEEKHDENSLRQF